MLGIDALGPKTLTKRERSIFGLEAEDEDEQSDMDKVNKKLDLVLKFNIELIIKMDAMSKKIQKLEQGGCESGEEEGAEEEQPTKG